MKARPARLVLLVLIAAAPAAHAQALRCATSDGEQALALVRDHRGGSMGNPAQRGAYLLRAGRGGPVLLQCPRGFRNGSLECGRHALGPPPGHFLLDRETGAFELVLAATGRAERRTTGTCVPAG